MVGILPYIITFSRWSLAFSFSSGFSILKWAFSSSSGFSYLKWVCAFSHWTVLHQQNIEEEEGEEVKAAKKGQQMVM